MTPLSGTAKCTDHPAAPVRKRPQAVVEVILATVMPHSSFTILFSMKTTKVSVWKSSMAIRKLPFFTGKSLKWKEVPAVAAQVTGHLCLKKRMRKRLQTVHLRLSPTDRRERRFHDS